MSEPLKDCFAKDQYGKRWIVFQRSGSTWALGLDDDGMPAIRFMGDDNTIDVDLSKPRGVRILHEANSPTD